MTKEQLETLESIFSFDEKDFARDFFYRNKMKEKFIQAFNYVCGKLPVQKIPKDLEKLKWDKGKNYSWAIVEKDSLTLMIRQFGHHFTFFSRNRKKLEAKKELPDEFTDLYYSQWSCFTIYSNQEKMKDPDMIVEDNFYDLNPLLPSLLDFLSEEGPHLLWNTYAFKRPEWVEVKNAWNGGEDISSMDMVLFAFDELFNKYLELFAENDMIEKVKTFNVGDRLGAYEITKVGTKLKDNYYYNVGLSLKNTNFPDSEPSWADVYSLSRYYLDSVFQPEEKETL
jgi:hypothetical protein